MADSTKSPRAMGYSNSHSTSGICVKFIPVADAISVGGRNATAVFGIRRARIACAGVMNPECVEYPTGTRYLYGTGRNGPVAVFQPSTRVIA